MMRARYESWREEGQEEGSHLFLFAFVPRSLNGERNELEDEDEEKDGSILSDDAPRRRR